MSGPKCETYYVESERNELLQRARLADAQRAGEEARTRLNAAIADARKVEKQFDVRIDSIRSTVPNLPQTNASVEECEKYVAAVQTTIGRIGAEVGRAEGLAQLRALVATSTQTTQVSDWSDQLQQSNRGAHTSGTVASKPHDRDARIEATQRIVGRLEGRSTEEELQNIRALVSEIIATSNAGRAESLETQLRLRVQLANERVRRAQHERAEASRLLEQLRGLEGKEIGGVRDDLQAVRDGQAHLQPDMSGRVETARRAAEKRSNDAYASLVFREELNRLGYSTGEEFTTLFVDGGEAIVIKPEQPEYGVQMRVDASRGTVDLEVVHFGNEQEPVTSERKLRDKNVEERWCQDHQKLRSAMRTRGITGRMVRELPPGARPVKTVGRLAKNKSRAADTETQLQRKT